MSSLIFDKELIQRYDKAAAAILIIIIVIVMALEYCSGYLRKWVQ